MASAEPEGNIDDDNALLRRLKAFYGDSSLATVRPAHWSTAMGLASAGAGALLFLMRATVPPVAAASCLGGAAGFGYSYACFAPGAAREDRREGFLAGVGTSAIVACGNASAFIGTRNPLLLNMIMLSSVSALYCVGLAASEGVDIVEKRGGRPGGGSGGGGGGGGGSSGKAEGGSAGGAAPLR